MTGDLDIYTIFIDKMVKIKNIFRFPLTVFCSILIVVILTGYGNKNVHPDLNSMMVDTFLKQSSIRGFASDDFKKYRFNFGQGETLKGTAITKNGLFSATGVAAAGVVGNAGAVVD